MNFMYKQTILLSFFIVSCFAGNIISASSPLSATFQIIPHTSWALSHEDWAQSYLAKVIVTNNGYTKVSGWQLNFNFTTADQTIKRIWNGLTTTASNPITITNNPQLITIMPGTSRSVYLVVNSSNLAPAVPLVTATAVSY